MVGDEFVLLIGDLDVSFEKSMDYAAHVADKIRTSLSEPYLLRVHRDTILEKTIEHRCSASIGVYVFMDHMALLMIF